jgi:hypothetical protein
MGGWFAALLSCLFSVKGLVSGQGHALRASVIVYILLKYNK